MGICMPVTLNVRKNVDRILGYSTRYESISPKVYVSLSCLGLSMMYVCFAPKSLKS